MRGKWQSLRRERDGDEAMRMKRMERRREEGKGLGKAVRLEGTLVGWRGGGQIEKREVL